MMQQKVKTTRAPGLRLDKNRRLTPMQIYCWATVACLAVLLAIFLVSRGELVHQFFFHAPSDTGMDFFHSIEYVKGRMPYGLFGTLYPPLANLLFYVLYRFVPESQSEKWAQSLQSSTNMKGSEQDLRLQQATMLLFIFFVVLVVLGMIAMAERATRGCDGRRDLLMLCIVFSYGVLCGLERGNILLLCWPLMVFFVLYRNSQNPILRELACLALAVAAGLKLYPAFLGVLLLKDKNYIAAIRTVIYGIVCFIFPLFFFNEGLYGLTLWIRVLFAFSENNVNPWVGNGFPNIIQSVGRLIDHFTGTRLAFGNYAIWGFMMAALLLICAMFMDCEWKCVTSIVLAILMFQSQYDYVFCLFLIPLLLFFAQEKNLRRDNVLPYALLVLFTIPLPLFRADTPKPLFTVRNSLYHAAMIVLAVWCFAEAVRGLRHRTATGKRAAVSRRQMRATVVLAAVVVVAGVGGQQLWQRTHNWGFDYSYNGRLDAEGIQQKDVLDSDGNPVEAIWSGRGAYIMIYNHAPFTQRMTVTFQTGYGMDLKRAYTMTFEAPNLEDADGTTGKQKQTDIKIDHEGQTMCYTVDVVPGQTQIDVSYDGPMAVYDASSRKNGTFTVTNLVVASEGAVEETE